MDGFKGQVEKDRLSTFLDINTFAENHTVEGRSIPIMIDNDELRELQGGQDLAVAESGTLFYARVEDLPRCRSAGESLNIDGRECLIDDWKEQMGIAIVALRENII